MYFAQFLGNDDASEDLLDKQFRLLAEKLIRYINVKCQEIKPVGFFIIIRDIPMNMIGKLTVLFVVRNLFDLTELTTKTSMT